MSLMVLSSAYAENEFQRLRQQAFKAATPEQHVLLYRQCLAAWQESEGLSERQSVAKSLAYWLDMMTWKTLAIKQNKAETLAILPIIKPWLEEAIQVAPDYAPVYRSLGYAYYKAAMYEQAIPIFRKGLDLPEIAADVLRFWWTSLKDLGRTGEMLAYLEPITASNPDYNRVYYLSKTYQLLNRIPEATGLIKVFLADRKKLTENELWLYSQLLLLLDMQGEWKQAMAAGQEYLARGGDPKLWDFVSYYVQVAKQYGQEQFGLGNYDQAEFAYQQALEYMALAPSLREQDEIQREPISARLAQVRERRDLGQIKPRQTYRILALTITRIDASYTNLSGQPVRYQNPALDPLSLKWRTLAQNHLARSIETWSHGNMTVVFEEQTIDATITDFHLNWFGNDPKSNNEMRTAKLESIKPSIMELLLTRCNEFDSLLVYYNGANGVGGGLHGRSMRFEYQPGLVSKAWRGTLDIPLNFIARYEGPSILVHEFFHNIESICGIKVQHGYLAANRNAFPSWKGEGEIDYYRWHFDHTLATKGGEHINFRKTWPETLNLTLPTRVHDGAP